MVTTSTALCILTLFHPVNKQNLKVYSVSNIKLLGNTGDQTRMNLRI